MNIFCGTNLPVHQNKTALQCDCVGSQERTNNKANPMQAVMDKLGNGLVKLGEDVISAGGHLGGMFVGLGNNLRGTM